MEPTTARKSITSIKPRVQTISTKIGAPAAIPRIVGREHGRIRLRILVRDGAACVKCGCGVDLEVDHIVPLFLGGQESDLNRQVLCVDCHRAKTEQEEKERRM
jgi:5-methylcytosine-specific restriction protein A